MATVARHGREHGGQQGARGGRPGGGALHLGRGAPIIRGPRILLTKWELWEGNGRV